MHRARVIPSLLLHEGGLVKTVRFSQPRYIGDPINTVRIFNEKEVDELLIFDIDATVHNRPPQTELIEEIVGEAFMPIGYGGGVKSVAQMYQLFRAGVEKISLSSAALENRELVREASREFGRQAVVVTLDLKRRSRFFKGYALTIRNGSQQMVGDPIEVAKEMEELGAGELLLNFVDRDGTMQGYDLNYIREMIASLRIPVIALGGAGARQDLRDVIRDAGASAAAAGSIFVYYGKHRAVLINYPSQEELSALLGEEKI